MTLGEFKEVRFDSVYRATAREHKSVNCHRAILELQGKGMAFTGDDFEILRKEIRAQFRVSFLRGFGFGVFLNDFDVPPEFVENCIDNTTRRGGACQWMIAARARDRQALGVHMWQKGRMTPVYEAMLAGLRQRGFTVVNRARGPKGIIKLGMFFMPLLVTEIYRPPADGPETPPERDA